MARRFGTGKNLDALSEDLQICKPGLGFSSEQALLSDFQHILLPREPEILCDLPLILSTSD